MRTYVTVVGLDFGVGGIDEAEHAHQQDWKQNEEEEQAFWTSRGLEDR